MKDKIKPMMKQIAEREIMIDALTVCFEVKNRYNYELIEQIGFGDKYDMGEFHLYRVEGRYYDNVYSIRFKDEHGITREFGHLKFNINHGNLIDNNHDNGNPKVWITINNRCLYTEEYFYLDYIATSIGLEPHNITSLDLCFDTSFSVSKKLRRLIRDETWTTILNGKRIRDRDKDLPEITYTMSGSLNKDKYMTVNIKQRNAIKDKTKGITVITYDKVAEIKNSSEKDYIMDYYGNPKNLHRTEVHLNNKEVRDYLANREIILNFYLMNKSVLEDMFFYHLDSVIRFQRGRDNIRWRDLLKRKSA